MARQYTLEGSTIDEVKAQALALYGADARIISAEQVVQGGILGVLAKRFVEAVIEVPDSPLSDPPPTPGMLAPTVRPAMLALLADVEDAEERMTDAPRRVPQLSTGSADFGALMDDLSRRAQLGPQRAIEAPRSATAAVSASASALLAHPAARLDPRLAAAVPSVAERETPPAITPSSGSGDLVLFVGQGDAALPYARALARAGAGAELRAGGADATLRAHPPVNDRRSAFVARASGVNADRPVYVGYSVAPGAAIPADLAGIAADQVWLLVDASMKTEDSARWVRAVRAVVTVDVIGALGVDRTASPETLLEHGLPVFWPSGFTLPA